MRHRKSSEPEQSNTNNLAAVPSKQQTSHRLARRAVLSISGIAVLILGSRQITPALASQNVDAIRQPANPVASNFMERAFEMREIAVERGDQAYGAVVVRNNQIVGQSWSRVVIDRDPTAHAEMSAIRDAARRLSDRDLSGAVMYSSSRPCPMCEAAAYWAGIDQPVYGRNLNGAGAPKLCG